MSGFDVESWVHFSCQRDIHPNCFGIISTDYGSLFLSMHANEEVTELTIGAIVGFVTYYKEQVESGHNGRRNIQIMLQVL